MKAKALKAKIMKFRKSAFKQLMKLYEVKDQDKEVKIISKAGEHYILINDEHCWKEQLEFKGNEFTYNMVPIDSKTLQRLPGAEDVKSETK